jgi:hypothetical protein
MINYKKKNYVMNITPHLNVVKDFWNLKYIFLFLFIFLNFFIKKIHIFLIVRFF